VARIKNVKNVFYIYDLLSLVRQRVPPSLVMCWTLEDQVFCHLIITVSAEIGGRVQASKVL